MAKERILICDDDFEASCQWATELKAIAPVKRGFQIDPCKPDDFIAAIEELQKRRLHLRDGDHREADTVFDDLAVLVVDYDLQDKDPRSGREVAYLARCFSSCGVIISLNEHGENPFDLTLTEYADSFADLNIGGPIERRGRLQQRIERRENLIDPQGGTGDAGELG